MVACLKKKVTKKGEHNYSKVKVVMKFELQEVKVLKVVLLKDS